MSFSYYPALLLCAVTVLPCLAASSSKMQTDYGKLPLTFERNQGQTDPRVKFLAHGDGSGLFLTPDEAVLAFAAKGSVLRMRFAGSNETATMEGVGEVAGKTNYLVGNDPAKWRSSVANYEKVRYRAVYPGIDVVYYGQLRQLEYDLVVAPGADPRLIRLSFPEVQGSRIDSNGDLVISLTGGEVRQFKPVGYQEVNGRKVPVQAAFVMRANKEIGFQVAKYDRTRELVIDPAYGYSTLLGGNGEDSGIAIAVDGSRNAYIAGSTASTDFPGTSGGFQIAKSGTTAGFVAKLNDTGSALAYFTYLGGSKISIVSSLAVDAAGNAFLTGRTNAPDFPVTPGAAQFTFKGTTDRFDAFVAKLNSTGSALVYSTYLGGINNDYGYAIAADAAGNAYVTGLTTSADFPKTDSAVQAFAGNGDVFVSKLNPAGTALLYSTFVGGTGEEGGIGIGVDAAGVAVVCGYTFSVNFPTTTGALKTTFGGAGDGFVMKLNAAGSALLYSTYIGGSREDEADFVALDAAGNAYVTGFTSSRNFATSANAFQKTFRSATGTDDDGYVMKLNSAGELVYSTLLGGSSHDAGYYIAVDSTGNAFITGYTDSDDFPPVRPRQSYFGGRDGFLTKLDAAGGALLDSTFIGGVNVDLANAVAIDSTGAAYVVGYSESLSFISTQGALQNRLAGTRDAFVTKFTYPTQQVSLHAVVNAANYKGGAVSPGEVVTIYGSPVGPGTLLGLQLDASGKVSTTLGGTRVLFDGVPAPLIYVSAGQSSAVVPYDVATKTRTEVQVEYQGVKSNPVLIAVTPATPSVFTANASGTGQGAILNQDNSVNSESNPAAQGSVIVIYGTGGGQTNPVGVTGGVTASASTFVLPVRVDFGELAVPISGTVQYAGAAPGLVQGVMQVNVKTPGGLRGKWAVKVRVGTVSSTAVDVYFGDR